MTTTTARMTALEERLRIELASTLRALIDLDAGYPSTELHAPLEEIIGNAKAALAAAGVNVLEEF